MGSIFEGPQIKTPKLDATLSSASTGARGLKPLDVSAGGLTGRVRNGALTVGASRGRRRLVDRLADQFLTEAGLVSGLRGRVAPGVSELRASRLAGVENARSAAISDLKDNLARRRVLGSSFGADAVTRSELQFAQERDKVEAETFLQELDLTHKLIGEEFNLRRGAFDTKLKELNLQADFATGLTAQATDMLTASAQLQSQIAMIGAQLKSQLGIAQSELDAKAQEGAGSLFGLAGDVLLGPALGRAGEAISESLFG